MLKDTRVTMSSSSWEMSLSSSSSAAMSTTATSTAWIDAGVIVSGARVSSRIEMGGAVGSVMGSGVSESAGGGSVSNCCIGEIVSSTELLC